MHHLSNLILHLEERANQQGASWSARRLAVLAAKYSAVELSVDDVCALARQFLVCYAAEYASRFQRDLPERFVLLPAAAQIKWLCTELESCDNPKEKHLTSRCIELAHEVFDPLSITSEADSYRVALCADLIACHAQLEQFGYHVDGPFMGFFKWLGIFRKEEANWGWAEAVLPELDGFLSLKDEAAWRTVLKSG